ncbi:OmpA family protein [Lewinella sp. LCG006]|uniref:OmpA family protein n=1 Tax=Lewinella sp. LCG006 TaxID=3231911 RepID=UPI00345F9A6D
MSTLMKWLIMLLAWLAFSVITFRTCVKDNCCTACTTETTTEEVTPPPAETSVTRYPVDSKLGYAAVDTTDQFTSWKNAILAGMEDGKMLEVEGIYYASETAPDGYENMGFARAAKTIELLSPYIPKDRMRPVARLVEDDSAVGDGYFLAANTRWLVDGNLNEAEVITISADEKIILFPNASDRAIEEATVIAYLDELAAYLKANPSDRVEVTGHASQPGDADENMRYSRKRAERVKAMLVSRGVDAAQISVAFKGETQLYDSGDTDEAHRRNRRAVVKLIRSGK